MKKFLVISAIGSLFFGSVLVIHADEVKMVASDLWLEFQTVQRNSDKNAIENLESNVVIKGQIITSTEIKDVSVSRLPSEGQKTEPASVLLSTNDDQVVYPYEQK